jgi:hypothetical protein
MSQTRSNPAMATSNGFQILDAIKKEDSINVFVFNITTEKKGRNSNSKVIFTVPNGNEDSIVTIPMTWIPINVGLQAPKAALFESKNFLRAVSSNLLRPISTTEAIAFFRDNPDASEEYDRIVGSLSNNDMPGEDGVPALPPMQVEEELPSGVSPTVINIVARFNSTDNPDITESETYSLIRNLEKTLSKEDLNHILANIKSERIQQFANRILQGSK